MATLSRRAFLNSAACAGLIAASRGRLRAEEKPRIKIGQIGVGHAHASKLGVYRRSSAYEVVGICEPNAELRAQAEAQPVYRDLPWMTTEQLLNVPDLQAVLVETQVRDLLPAAELCIAAGKHIHLDKPAGNSLPHFRKILDAAAAKKLLVQLGYMYRYNPGFLLLKDLLKRGWLGEIFEVHTVMSKVVPPSQRKALAAFPGGIMFELGCHVIDLVVGILGKPAGVTAFPQQVVAGDALKDNMLAVFTYPKATASVRSSAVEVDGGARRHLVVCGTEGTLHIQPLDNPSARLTLASDRGDYRRGAQELKLPRYERYVADAADMAQILRGEKPSDYSYEHDFVVQETLLKACG
jgi:predicted dehydrogenase